MVLVEYKVDLSPWIPDCRGTADAIVFAGRTLHVVDLKYGKGVGVDVTENEQLEAYALGAAAEFGGGLGVFEGELDGGGGEFEGGVEVVPVADCLDGGACAGTAELGPAGAGAA